MPYAAMLFGCRDQQIPPLQQDDLLKNFKKGNHIPMFIFAQNKKLGGIFRQTSVALAYTISPEAGKILKELVEYADHHRLEDHSNEGKAWIKKFTGFWDKHGKKMMDKLTGMKDPLLTFFIHNRAKFETEIFPAL